MNKIKLFFIVLLISGIFSKTVFSQKSLDLNAPLPVDSSIKTGKLKNGLTYYIKRNSKPEKRVELRLVVNAGSLYETDAQQGLAHFTEHMCFNGTKHFEHNELINVLEQMGIKFGADLNAYTSFAETVYRLQIPTDKKDLLGKGFLVLEDWAHNVTFDPVEIDKERGVVIEEWRLGLGAEDRMRKKAFPVILKDSRYAERIPIGKKEILDNFKYDTLRKFYHDWYRPDLMAVVIIGDVNVNEAEKLVKEHFEKIENPKNEKPGKEYGIPENKEPLVSIVTDPEATSNRIAVVYKKTGKIDKTINDYRESIVKRMYIKMLNNRLYELTGKTDCPLVRANAGYGEYIARSCDAYTCTGIAKENQIGKGFESLLAENERVKRFGFTETEFSREKAEFLKDIANRLNESDKTESDRFVRDCIDNFLKKKPMIGFDRELLLMKTLLPEITIEEVNNCAKRWITDNDLIIEISGPQKDNVKIPAKDTLLQILKGIKIKPLSNYIDVVSDRPLISQVPKGGKVVSKKVNNEQDFTELTLSNGVKVVLKSTDFKNDEILLSAYSPGGTSLYRADEFMTAKYAANVVDASGVCSFTNDELLKKLQGKIAEVSPFIDELKEGFTGKSSVADFETLLQLTYLYFTCPGNDTTGFNSFISKLKSRIKFIGENPQFAFNDTLMKLSTMNDPRTLLVPALKQVEQIKPGDLYRIYHERFSNAGNFTFFIVGKFNADSLVPKIETYLGSLPAVDRKETWKDVTPRFPAGITEAVIHKGIADKGMVGIVMNDNFEWSEANRISFSMMIEVLRIKLREKIREDEGGTYGLQIRYDFTRYPENRYNVTINFGCDPGRAKELVKQAFEVIKGIQTNGPDSIVLAKVKATLIREREISLKQNRFWIRKLETEYFNNEQIKSLNDYNTSVTNFSPADIRNMAVKYITLDHYVEVILMPEKNSGK